VCSKQNDGPPQKPSAAWTKPTSTGASGLGGGFFE
jgi:hypothetical protein